MVNTTIQYENMIIIIIVPSAPASTRPDPRGRGRGQDPRGRGRGQDPRGRGRGHKILASRGLEAEARTLEAKVEVKVDLIQFWPSEL